MPPFVVATCKRIGIHVGPRFNRLKFYHHVLDDALDECRRGFFSITSIVDKNLCLPRCSRDLFGHINGQLKAFPKRSRW
jgi:hypothetical protein